MVTDYNKCETEDCKPNPLETTAEKIVRYMVKKYYGKK
jgi:hypothetical protein